MQINKHGGPDGYENFWKLLSPKVSESLQIFANFSSTFQRRSSHLRFTGRYTIGSHTFKIAHLWGFQATLQHFTQYDHIKIKQKKTRKVSNKYVNDIIAI